MKLNAELAQKIVKEARSSLNEHFIIVDTDYRIIASSEPERVGHFHEGAKMAIDGDRTIDIKPEDVALLEGVKPGINMPIKHLGKIIGVIGITGNPTDVRPYADLIRRLTELFIREAVQADQLETQSRAIESFVYEWVHRDTLDKNFLEQSEILGIPLSEPFLIILGKVEQTKTSGYPLIKAQIQKQLNHKHDRLVRWSDNRFLLLMHQNSYDRLLAEEKLLNLIRIIHQNTNIRVTLGVAKTPRKNVIKSSYDEAQKALMTANWHQPVVFYETLSLDLLLQDISLETREAFIQNTWQPIMENNELLETLKTYLNEDLSVSKAAHVLHIHVNTLHYRIKRIEELTGVDLHTTMGIVTAYLVIRILND